MSPQNARTAAAGLDDLRDLLTDFRRHLTARNKAPNTIDSYCKVSQDFVDWLVRNGQSTDAPDVDYRVIEEYFVEFQTRTHHRTGKPLAAAYVAKHYRSLQQFWKWLAEVEQVVDVSPMVKTSPPAVPEQPVPVLTEAQLRALLATTEGRTFENVRDRAIMLMFVDTPCRLGEVAPVKVDDFDFDAAVVSVMGKGRRARDLPFGATTGEALRRYFRARARHKYGSKTERAWVGRQGPLTEFGVRQMLNRRAADAEIPAIHPHLFRHTFSHRWLADGGQEQDLMRLAGWKSRQMLARYGASVADERARDAHRKTNLTERLV